MVGKAHWAIRVNNQSDKKGLINRLLRDQGSLPAEFKALMGLRGALFSKSELDKFIEEEERHDLKFLNPDTEQHLQSFSSGERKKALLAYILKDGPGFIILDNPFDNLDRESQSALREKLEKLAARCHLVLIISREADMLPFIQKIALLKGNVLHWLNDKKDGPAEKEPPQLNGLIPKPL